ncbi:Glycine betaine-binding protein OpuAC precursor [Halomonas sp. THAF12]|uniref:ABC transporter substrate-binding protein n=1 Tax=Halomonas sp. THAF12 TaxID=2587849 RepID=UPI0012A94B13|nr:ABC transporter substrate-binding protein [Halomonas sp. THAF12]QFT83943.1 Glycine betaine-binding protein OpuAC precursor [Halomonas sp. THAF12]
MRYPKAKVSTFLGGSMLAVSLSLAAPYAVASEDVEVTFASPPWPGVTVKTTIASMLLGHLGYETSQQEVSVAIAYEALETGDVDAFLAAWLPNQQALYRQYVEKGSVLDLGGNVEGGQIGLVVPRYVAEAGVTSAEDLDKQEFSERFGRTIYSIEAGSGASEILNQGVEDDIYGIGDWALSETSTPGMLSAIDNAIDREEWVVFHAWNPHWMNIEYDVVYLDDPEGMWGDDGGRTEIRTLMNPGFSDAHPNIRRFLDQLAFTADDQSAMIRGFSYEERSPEAVAHDWVNCHPQRIREFVEGVTTREGEAAWSALQEAFSFSDA